MNVDECFASWAQKKMRRKVRKSKMRFFYIPTKWRWEGKEFQSDNSKQDSHRLHYLKALLKHKHDKSIVIEKCRGKKKAQHNSNESETFEMYNSEIKHLKVKKRNHSDRTATTSEARFSDPDRSLNRKRERFKVFEVEPRSNRGWTVMT